MPLSEEQSALQLSLQIFSVIKQSSLFDSYVSLHIHRSWSLGVLDKIKLEPGRNVKLWILRVISNHTESTLSRQQLTTTEDKTLSTYKVADFLFLSSSLLSSTSSVLLFRCTWGHCRRIFHCSFYKYGFYLGLGRLTLMLELHVLLVDIAYYGFPNWEIMTDHRLFLRLFAANSIFSAWTVP